jgi:Flp pilus assembly protein TadD
MHNYRFRSLAPTLFHKLIALQAVTLVLMAAGFANAQGVGASRGLPGSDGIHTIQGRVYSPNGRQIGSQLRIRLESNESPAMSTVTDADGAFQFRNLNAGEYRLTVEGGSQFEDTTESASIYREASGGGRIVTLAIQMRLKLSADPAFASVPPKAIELYKKALEASQKGDAKKAVGHLNNAIALDSNFGPALVELGAQYLKLGDAVKAAEALATAVKLLPNDFQPHLLYGIALLNQKKNPEAEKELADAVGKNSGSATAHMYLGIAYMSQKKLDEAEKELQLSVAANSSEIAVAHKYLGGIYWGKREYAKAAQELETYLKLAPKAADADRIRQSIEELKHKQ